MSDVCVCQILQSSKGKKCHNSEVHTEFESRTSQLYGFYFLSNVSGFKEINFILMT